MADQDDFGAPLSSKRDRRSGIDRRWIKFSYEGQERRSGQNRRQDKMLKNPLLHLEPSPINAENLEKLLVSATLQLEAIKRLLIKKGLIDQEELQRVLADIHDEYQLQTED